MFNPTEGLQEISKADIRPGDEIVWTWNGSQVRGWTYYVHAIVPVPTEDTKWARRKAQDEIDLIVEGDRTFYLVNRT